VEQAECRFGIGDTVEEKSTSKRMTVADEDCLPGDPRGIFVECVWTEFLDKKPVLRSKVVPESSLLPVRSK
jgi:hypothetical protein